MCFVIHGLRRYKPRDRSGGAALDQGPRLLIDAPVWAQVREHWPKAVYWVMFEVIAAVKLHYRLSDSNVLESTVHCDETGTQYSCSLSAGEMVVTILQAVFMLGYSVAYCYYQIRAQRDHAGLPFVRFRLSFLYLKTHVRWVFVCVCGGGERGENTCGGLQRWDDRSGKGPVQLLITAACHCAVAGCSS